MVSSQRLRSFTRVGWLQRLHRLKASVVQKDSHNTFSFIHSKSALFLSSSSILSLSLFFLPCFCSLRSVVRVSIRYRLRPTFGNRSSMSGERTSLSWLKLRSTLDVMLVSFSSSSFSLILSSLLSLYLLPFLFSFFSLLPKTHHTVSPSQPRAKNKSCSSITNCHVIYIYITVNILYNKKQSLPSFPSLPTFSPPLLLLFLLSSFSFVYFLFICRSLFLYSIHTFLFLFLSHSIHFILPPFDPTTRTTSSSIYSERRHRHISLTL